MSSKFRHYFELTRELAVNDFKLKYNNSILGYFWSLLKPAALFFVLYLVFSVFLKIGGGEEYFQFYLLLGIILWMFFADGTLVAMQSIVAKENLIKKIYVPKIIIILASSLTSLFTFILNLAVFFIFILIFKAPLSWSLILFPFYILEFYIFVLGLALILSAFYVQFRDLTHIWEIFLQILFYLTPIIYPLSIIPQKFHWVIFLNPLAQIIQDLRLISISRAVLTTPFKLQTILAVGTIFIIGLIIFNKKAPYFAEKI